MSATSRFPAGSWAPMTAPSLEDFEVMADEAFRQLPESFRKMCGDVIVRMEDFGDRRHADILCVTRPGQIG